MQLQDDSVMMTPLLLTAITGWRWHRAERDATRAAEADGRHQHERPGDLHAQHAAQVHQERDLTQVPTGNPTFTVLYMYSYMAHVFDSLACPLLLCQNSHQPK